MEQELKKKKQKREKDYKHWQSQLWTTSLKEHLTGDSSI